MSKRLTISIIILLSFLGILSILLVTKLGIGTSPDAIVYIGAARNLLQGKGLSIPFGQIIDSPMTHHAPLYPVILGIVGLLNIDPIIGARWLNAIAFGCLISFTGFSLMKLTQPSKTTPILGSFIMLTAYPIIVIHAHAWTEPIFILLGLSGMFLISIYAEKPSFIILFFSALLMGLATLTRYAGIALIGTGFLSIIIFSKKKLSARFINAFAFGVISSLPLILWLFRNSRVAGTATSRNLAFHLVTKQQLIQFLNTLSEWLLIPERVPGIIKFLVIFFIVGIVIAYAAIQIKKHLRTKKFPSFVLILCLFIFIYPTFLIVSISFLDANTPLDDRILSPLFVSLLIVILYFLDRIFRSAENHQALKLGLATLAIFFSVMYLYNGVTWITNNSNNGLGFSSKVWENSELILQINELPPDSSLFSNAPHAVYILTGKSTQALPKERFATTHQANEDFLSEISELHTQIQNRNGYIIYFNSIAKETEQYEKILLDQLSLQIFTQTSEGKIYQPKVDEQ